MIGTRAEVYHGTKTHTAGGLTKDDLIKNRHGRIVSKKVAAQQRAKSNLGKHKFKQKFYFKY